MSVKNYLLRSLLLLQVRRSIASMSDYVNTQEIQGDKDGDQEGGEFDCKIQFNLQKILSHLEDLMTIREWVGKDQLANMYLNPEPTDISDK